MFPEQAIATPIKLDVGTTVMDTSIVLCAGAFAMQAEREPR
jgi:hypothetical protein